MTGWVGNTVPLWSLQVGVPLKVLVDTLTPLLKGANAHSVIGKYPHSTPLCSNHNGTVKYKPFTTGQKEFRCVLMEKIISIVYE